MTFLPGVLVLMSAATPALANGMPAPCPAPLAKGARAMFAVVGSLALTLIPRFVKKS
jgi:hypothetical protein